MLKYSKYTNTKNVQCELKKVENANHVYGNKLIMFTKMFIHCKTYVCIILKNDSYIKKTYVTFKNAHKF